MTTTVAALRTIANLIEPVAHLTGHVTILIHPAAHGDTTAVDRIAEALGSAARDRLLGDNSLQRQSIRYFGRVEVTVLTEVTEPARIKRARLAAELARLDEQIEATS